VIARACVALLAVVVLAWLAVMERDARLQAEGVDAARQVRAPGNYARADAAFRGARLLNPDTTPDVFRAFLYEGGGHSRAAAALLDDVLRREPDNAGAWGVRLAFARHDDPAAAARARAALRRLDPVGARSG
jgi:hypothetical protein